MDASNNELNTGLGSVSTESYNYLNNFLSNPSVIIILVVVVVLYVIIFMSLGGSASNAISGPNSDGVSNKSSQSIGVIVIGIFVILAVINGLQYFFGIDIVASLKNLFSIYII